MSEDRIRIEGTPEALVQLRRELLEEVGDEVEVRPLSAAAPGELREPVLLGLALTFPVAAVTAVCRVIERRMTHRERMEELRIYWENSDREISIAELTAGL